MSSGSHLSKELLDLVKSIGESRSKQEEDKIITAESQILKQKFLERNLTEKKMRELLIRAIYVEMLGHDASFSHIHAVNLTQSKNLLVKKIGYLACQLFIDDNSELVILMICTIQRDLQSKNHLEVLAALQVLTKVCNQHIIMAVNEAVQRLMTHPHEMIRKKSVMVINKFHKYSPNAIEQVDLKMKKALCDKDPSVMQAALNFFAGQVKERPGDFKDLVNSFVVILKQIIEHRLPKDYDYHRLPAPWIQMKILEVLSYLGADDKAASEQMFEILSQVLKKADDSGINIGYALVYQCLKTITLIYPSQSLIDASTNTVSRFLSSESHNLKYIGITGLAYIVKIDPKYTLNYQGLVVDCLEDADDTLKIKTLDLLYRMTNKQNVEPIVEKLLSSLKEAPIDSSVRKDLVLKINALCEKYSPNKNWYVRTMNKLYEMGGDLITPDLSNKFISSICEYEKEIDGEKFRDSTIKIYLKILKKNPNIPDSLLQVISWIMGEYGAKLVNQKKMMKIIENLCSAAYRTLEDELTRSYIISAITKLQCSLGFPQNQKVEDVMTDYLQSKHIDVQQRAIEYKQIKDNFSVLGPNGKEVLLNTPLNEQQVFSQGFDYELTFLDDFVMQQLNEGKRSYDKKRSHMGHEQAMEIVAQTGLNFGPYAAPQRGFVKAISDMPQSNPLFQPKEPERNEEGLIVQGVRKRWGEANQPEPAPQQKIDSHYSSQNNLKMATGIDHNQGELVPYNPGQMKQPQQQQQVPGQKGQQNEQRTAQINALFSGIANEEEHDSDGSDEKKKKKKKKDKKKSKEDKKEEKKEEEGQQPPQETNLMNLLEFDEQPTLGTSSDNLQGNTSGGQGNLLDDLLTTSPAPSLQSKQFQPVAMPTDKFGEHWLKILTEKKANFVQPAISSPEKFSQTIQNKANLNPIQIINNEVICAGQSNGNLCLLHCRVQMGGQLEITGKSESLDTLDYLFTTVLTQLMISPF